MVRNHATPLCLWRIFSERAHAESLVRGGIVRLGRLDIYQQIDDSNRRDRTEGEAIFSAPGVKKTMIVDRDSSTPTEMFYRQGYPETHFSSTPRTYVYCCSCPPRNDPSLLLESFGKHRVKIGDPQRFIGQIAKAATTHPLAGESTTAECIPVSYDKGARLEEPPSDPIELSYSQKYPEYQSEYEYRIVVRVRFDLDSAFVGQPDLGLPEYIDLKLPAPLSYAEYSEFAG